MTPGSSPLRDAASGLTGEEFPSTSFAAGNVVIFRTGGIPEAVAALPCFHAIARAFPHERRILLTDAACGQPDSVQAVLAGTGLIDETIPFPSIAEQVRAPLALIQTLRQLAPGALVYLAEQPAALSVYRDLLMFKAAGIPRILGAPWNAVDGQCRADLRTGELEHEAERLARVLGADIPVDLDPPSWDLRLSVAERTAASQRLVSLPSGVLSVALAPGALSSAADWGEERWATLIGLLHLRLAQVGLVLVGAPEAGERGARLAALWPGPVVTLCGELPPRELAAVLERCGLLVCHEGGAMHLAASRGTACIALLGSLDRPHQWHPYGTQHVVIHAPTGIREIGVERAADAVVAAVDRLRTASGGPGVRPASTARAVSG
jgi:ADP-heptose:LPS heptosyltransferase